MLLALSHQCSKVKKTVCCQVIQIVDLKTDLGGGVNVKLSGNARMQNLNYDLGLVIEEGGDFVSNYSNIYAL